MPRLLEPSLGLRAFIAVASVFAVAGFAPSETAYDKRVQRRLYDHIETANRALLYGHTTEAVAYAEMVLLKRDITVYVDSSAVPWQIRDDANRALRDAMVNWEDALDREVHFRVVPRADADVVVRYAEGMRYDGMEAAGTTRWSRQVMNLGSDQYVYQVTANVSLRTYTPKGDLMNYRQMLHTAGHEFGHILGLDDSGRQGDLMGPLRLDRPVERASRSERESLLAVRQQADLVLQRVAGEGGGIQTPDEEERAMVVSEPAETIALQRTSTHISGGRRRAPAVRRPVRDEQAAPRAKGFKIGGMAR